MVRIRALSHLSEEALSAAEEAGLLHVNGSEWRYGDEANAGTSHKLSGGKWRRSRSKGKRWHGLIGLEQALHSDCRGILFVTEGGKDALAAYELLHRAELLPDAAVISALGSGYRPIAAEIQSLRGRKVVLIGDQDAAGRECMKLVSEFLLAHDIEHVALCWPESAKDLCELIENHDTGPIISALKDFFFPSPLSSHYSTFNYSTFNSQLSSQEASQEAGKNGAGFSGGFSTSSQEILELVERHVPTKVGTGNTFAFNLARELIERFGNDLGDEIIRLAITRWLERSRSLLPADANFDHTLRKFYGQLSRVKFTTTGLDAARERARNSPLPEIPGLSEGQRKAAALHRELQREADDGEHICPVNVLAEFLGLEWPEQARWIQRQLEKAEVIRCVKRGAPHTRGVKGRSTTWSYLKPL